MNKSTLVVRTETWSTRKGMVVKAVVRDADGRIIGATNSVEEVRVNPSSQVPTLIGKR